MKNKDVTVYRKKNKDGEYVDTDSFDTLRYSFGDVGGERVACCNTVGSAILAADCPNIGLYARSADTPNGEREREYGI